MADTLYGQYCPIAISLELLGNRWTLLVVRELLDGSSRFNDIHRGVPLMSRSLLSQRLKTLEKNKLVEKTHKGDYHLTEAGRALGKILFSVGNWGQEWLTTSSALDRIDGSYLMWNIKKSAKWVDEMGTRCVARFQVFEDRSDVTDHWLIIEPDETDLCYVNPGLEETVWINANLRSMVETWMGWTPLKQAMEAGDFEIDGPRALVDNPLRWIGQSPLAHVQKQSPERQVG